jgi:hypothetical protein
VQVPVQVPMPMQASSQFSYPFNTSSQQFFAPSIPPQYAPFNSSSQFVTSSNSFALPQHYNYQPGPPPPPPPQHFQPQPPYQPHQSQFNLTRISEYSMAPVASAPTIASGPGANVSGGSITLRPSNSFYHMSQQHPLCHHKRLKCMDVNRIICVAFTPRHRS